MVRVEVKVRVKLMSRAGAMVGPEGLVKRRIKVRVRGRVRVRARGDVRIRARYTAIAIALGASRRAIYSGSPVPFRTHTSGSGSQSG